MSNERQSETATLERDMTRAEIEEATENPDVDWGWINVGPRSLAETLWLRLSLWLRIVGRVNQADYRTGPLLAWTICKGHPSMARNSKGVGNR